MAQEQLIVAIGRLERALSRIEQADISSNGLAVNGAPAVGDADLAMRHDQLKAETRAAIKEIDALISAGAN